MEKHGVKLGFMSAFVKAASDALRLVPAVNAVIDGDELVYRDYSDISIAVATPKGLVVPVLRNVDALNFAGIEKVQSASHSLQTHMLIVHCTNPVRPVFVWVHAHILLGGDAASLVLCWSIDVNYLGLEFQW